MTGDAFSAQPLRLISATPAVGFHSFGLRYSSAKNKILPESLGKAGYSENCRFVLSFDSIFGAFIRNIPSTVTRQK
jgi:hypothetical protein